jgi:protein TonB
MLLSRPTLFAAAFSIILHVGMLGAAATWLVTQGRPAPASLKVTLLQRAVPLPVGEGHAPPGKAAEPEKQPDLAPLPPPKPQPKPKAPTPLAVTPSTPKAKKPLPPKKVVAPAPVAAPPQPAPLTLPTPQEGIPAETSAGESSAEMPKTGDDGRNATTGTQGAKATSGGGGFSARPDYGVNPKPPYPLIARRMETQGTVLLRVQVRIDGTVAEVQIAQSSGSALLDDSALQTVRDSWRFIPARLDGVPVESWVEVPIRFILGD